jgi:hypothetical protein
MSIQIKETKTKRSAPRYWTEIKGKLYARLQYKAEDGKYKVKYKAISDKRTSRSAVEEMRRELEIHGQKTLTSDKLTFQDFAKIYKETKLIPAVFENGVKISGRKSNADWAYNALVDYFGNRKLRSIRANDLESFKNNRLKEITRRGTKRNIATVNRELSLLRAMLNYALQNDWIIQNPFTKIKGIITTSAEVERDRV